MPPNFSQATVNASLEQRIRCFPFWDQLSMTNWEKIAPELKEQEIPLGTHLLQEGDDCQALLLVESGNIRVYRQAENGREITLY